MRKFAALSLCVLAGCAELPPGAKTTLADAKQRYLSGDHAGAETISAKVIDAYPRYAESAGAYYLRALCRVDRGDKAGAHGDLQRCIELSNDAKLTAKAHAMLGGLQYEAGDTASAIGHYAAALKILPEDSNNDIVHYQYALALQREGKWREARSELATVFQKYPGSPLAEYARRTYAWPHEYFTIQCGAFRDTGKANEQAAQLKRTHPDAHVESRTIAGEPLSIVVVGRFSTWREAETALDSVRRQASGAMIVP